MRLLYLIEFLFFYFKEIVVSNLRIAYEVLTPQHHMTPGILVVDVEGYEERKIAIMASLITMTPGTLGMFVSKDRKRLYIHCMYLDKEPEAIAADLAKDYGRRVQRVF